MYEYAGAIHIHSVYSDGSGTIEDIAKAAGDSGLDFIMMTDHNTLKPLEDGYERWINNVLVITGYEINDLRNVNHYLVFGLDKVIGTFSEIGNGELGCNLSANEYVRKINSEGGIGFIAHPDEKRNHMYEHPPYPWTEEESDEYTGIEIWNHMSEWVENLDEKNKFEKFIHPLKSIIAPNPESLKRWDRAALKRHVTGIGSVDAHAFKQSILGLFDLEIFPYKVLFKSIRTHVLVEQEFGFNNSGDFQSSKNQIIDALRKGRCFISNFYHGDARGFEYYAEDNNGKYQTGESIKFNSNIFFKAFIPKQCHYKLVHNGKTILESEGKSLSFNPSAKGIYRLECWINNKGWIFSNHIRLN